MTDEEVKLARHEIENALADAAPTGDCPHVRPRTLAALLRALDERTAERDEARERLAMPTTVVQSAIAMGTQMALQRLRTALAAREASVVKLREALRRLGSMEAFGIGGAASPERWAEEGPLRIDFAQAALSETPDLAALREFGERCALRGIVDQWNDEHGKPPGEYLMPKLRELAATLAAREANGAA